MNSVLCQEGPVAPLRRGCWATGQSAVELALALSVLLLLLLAGADFARVFYMTVAVNNAARAGAQYGSQTVITAANSNGWSQLP